MKNINDIEVNNPEFVTKKQTAVEWLCSQIYTIQVEIEAGNTHLKNKINQAKEMEKQQMFEYIKNNYCIGHRSLEFHRLEFEQYYNETFNKI
jgi:t-SNARE complex subunit (syntaxin)